MAGFIFGLPVRRVVFSALFSVFEVPLKYCSSNGPFLFQVESDRSNNQLSSILKYPWSHFYWFSACGMSLPYISSYTLNF